MKLIQEIRKRAKKIDATIVLPEANIDKRVYDACEFILKNNLSNIIVFGKDSEYSDIFKTNHCKLKLFKASLPTAFKIQNIVVGN